jgi:hypothetical protein
MKREYDVDLDGVHIGKITLVPAGLYYDIRCWCRPQGGLIRVVANCGDGQENIGLCVPQDGGMVIHTKIPQKRLQTIKSFAAITETKDEWVPIEEGKPIGCMDRIRFAKFAVRNGRPGLLIPQARQHKDH